MLATMASASSPVIRSSIGADDADMMDQVSNAAGVAVGCPVTSSSPQGIDTDFAFVLPKCELPPVQEFAPVETFVHKTIVEQNQQVNDNVPTKAYKGILEALRFKKDLSLVAKILLALRTSGKGTTLHLLASCPTKHARLIHHLVRFDPFAENPSLAKENKATAADANAIVSFVVADAHLHLLLALVSANSVYLLPTLTALWKMLALEYEQISADRTRRLHAGIASLMRLCPKGRTELFPIITANAPYRTRPESAIAWYYQHSLIVLQYLPAIQAQVLEFIVDKCLELDVEIKICDSGEVAIDDEPTENDEAIFALDEDKPHAAPLVTPADVTVDEMANKLDSLMLLLFQYSEQRSPTASIHSFYDVYARAFESSVLITHKSKFVQFLLFYVCGLDASTTSLHPPHEPLCRVFVIKLIEFVADPYRATVTRQTATCYLASLVSRASFVQIELVCESVAALLQLAEVYLQSLDGAVMLAADAKGHCCVHALFYTVCQAAFYIMCFRGPEVWSHVQSVPRTASSQMNLSPSRWQKICSSPMQPLRYCLESVRSEFLQLSRVFGLLDSLTLEKLLQDDALPAPVTRKKKSPMKIATAATLEKERKAGGVGGLGQGRNPLESFFPFDPYLLRQSHVYIEPFYNHWPGSIEERMAGVVVNHEMNVVVENDEDGSVLLDESDDDAADESGDEAQHVNVDDSDSDSTDDDGNESDSQLMSVASSAGDMLDGPFSEASDTMNREQQRTAWTHMLKRDRAPSMDYGSW